MNTENKKREYIFDAEGQSLGRMASDIAMTLRGKNEPSFEPNVAPDVTVTINNASKVSLNDSQLKAEYKRYSGYPGGLRHESREHSIERLGFQIVWEKAVKGMLPNNRLRPIMMKNLIINE
ncbi:MAG: 50S ribosomal protein L13 [Candidatus Pacebacteria bacterium]|nr:50S ribosomal protein L13 [Candidatus Paceibacterota bacterium]